jgi:hypothetical protein
MVDDRRRRSRGVRRAVQRQAKECGPSHAMSCIGVPGRSLKSLPPFVA